MRMSDLRILPAQGRGEFVTLCNECEDAVGWPWQLLEAIVMLEPEGESQPRPTVLSAGGDIALALLSWFGGCWGYSTARSIVIAFEKSKQPWGAAVPGQSCLREAMLRSI